MTRRVISASDAKHVLAENDELLVKQKKALAAGEQPVAPVLAVVPRTDSYETRLLKLIPADVITVFVALDGVIRTAGKAVPELAYWAIFAVLIVATFFYVMKVATSPELPTPVTQAVIAAVSFAVWVFALGGPFNYGSAAASFNPVFGAIVLPLYTFLIPLAMPGAPKPAPGS